MNIDIERYPFIQQELLYQIYGLNRKSHSALFYFTKYNIGYIGELAERWQEREVVKTEADLLALVMGIADSDSKEFYYDQKKQFVDQMLEYLEKKWNLLAATKLYQMIVEQEIETEKKQAFEERIVQSSIGQYGFPKQIFLINTLHLAKGDRNHVCAWMDEVRLDFTNPYPNTDYLLDFEQILYDIGKVKAQFFRSKGITTIFSGLVNLANKEIKTEQLGVMAKKLHTTVENIIILNFKLNKRNGRSQLTKPGEKRVEERYLETCLLRDIPVPGFFEDKLNHRLSTSFLYPRLWELKNKQHFQFILPDMTENLIGSINENYLAILKDERRNWLSKDMEKFIIEQLLLHYSDKYTKEDFLFLLELKKQAGVVLSYTSRSNAYAHFKHDIVSIDEVEKIISIGEQEYNWIKMALDYKREKFSYLEFLHYLEKYPSRYVPIHQKQNGTYNTTDFLVDYLKPCQTDEERKIVYRLYINGSFRHHTGDYVQRISRLLTQNEFIQTFQITPTQIEHVEKRLLQGSLLDQGQKEHLRIKYLSEAEKEKERIEKVKTKIEQEKYYWGINSLIQMNKKDIQNHAIVREAVFTLIEKKLTKLPLSDLAESIYLLKALHLENDEKIKELEEKALEMAQKKIDE